MYFQRRQKLHPFDKFLLSGAVLGEHNQPQTCQHILIQVLILTGEQIHLPLRPANRKENRFSGPLNVKVEVFYLSY